MARRSGGLTVTVKGVRTTVQQLTRWDRRLLRTLDAQTRKEGAKALATAKKGKFSDRTGRLRGTMAMKCFADSHTAVIFVAQKYGVYVNYGYDRRFQFIDRKKLQRKYKSNMRRLVRSQFRR